MNGRNALTFCAVAALAFAVQARGEDAWIENANGNQYFNTGHFVGPDTKIVLDFRLNETTLGIRPFGAAGAADATHPYCRAYLGQKTEGGPAWLSINHSKSDYSAAGYNVCEADLGRHTLVMDFPNKVCTVLTDGKAVATQTFPSVSPGRQVYPLGLFAECAHKSGAFSTAVTTWQNPAKMRVYGLEIYEAGALAKKFVPWVKGGVAGLMETVSGTFSSGENARSCVAGGDVTVEKDDAWVGFPDNDVTKSAAVAGKSMYFDTGYVFTPSSRMELDYALMTPDWTTSAKWADETYLFYAAGTSQMVYFMPYGSSANGRHYMKTGGFEGGITEVGVNYGYGVRRKIVSGADFMLMETAGYTNFNVKVSDSSKTVSQDLSSTTLTLGYRSGKTPLPMKIYGLKIYETADGRESLVRDYRPSIANSVPRLVDVLNPDSDSLPTVYNNTGTNIVFEAGGDIRGDDAAGEAYLDFDGVNGHQIDTGYAVTKDSRLELDFAVWNNNAQISGSEAPIFFEQRGYKDAASERNGIWFHLYHPTSHRYGWCYADYATAKNEWTGVYITNERTKFVIDSPANTITVYRNGAQVYRNANLSQGGTRTATTCTSSLQIGGNWNAKSNAGGMRLYSVKIYESDVLARNFVPYVRDGAAGLYETVEGTFFPLAGGKVRGAGAGGEEFQLAPADAKISRWRGSATLSCVAAGAQGYEWYEDGELLEGETSDTLELAWTHRSPHERTYSVVPVYTVFNETVRGEPASATVEYVLPGLVLTLR